MNFRSAFCLVAGVGAAVAVIASIFHRNCDEEEDHPGSPPPSAKKTKYSFKDAAGLKSHPLAFDEVNATTSLVHAFRLRRASSVLLNTSSSSIASHLYMLFTSPARLMRHLAYIVFCRCHILGAATAMLRALSSTVPVSCVPDTSLVAAASFLQLSYALIVHNPEIACPEVTAALLALEAFLASLAAPCASPLLGNVSSTYDLPPVPEVLLLEYHTTTSAAVDETTSSADNTFSAPAPAPRSTPRSPDATPAPADAPRGYPSPNNSNNDLYNAVLSVAVATYKDACLAGLMNFMFIQKYLWEQSRDSLVEVIKYAEEHAGFMPFSTLEAVKSDLAAIVACLSSSWSSTSVFEMLFSFDRLMSLVTSVSMIRNTAEGCYVLDATTRSHLVQAYAVELDFLTFFSAQLDAGNACFWSEEARVPFEVIGVYAVNAMAAIELNNPDWFDQDEKLFNSFEKVKSLWLEVHTKLDGGAPSPPAPVATSAPTVAPAPIVAAPMPLISIQRFNSGLTSGNATPLSESGAVLATGTGAAMNTAVDVDAGSQEADALEGEAKTQKKKKTRRGKKKNKNKNNNGHYYNGNS